MSDKDKDKNEKQDKNPSRSGNEHYYPRPNANIEKGLGNSEERSKTTREEWDKIDKKGQGAGDRPKRE